MCLASDNNWHRLNEFTRHGNTVPAAEVASTATGHVTTAAIPAGTEPTTFLAMGANRLEGMPPMQYGLEVGDFINLTNTTPDPDQQSAFVYIGPPLAAGANGMASDFVPLGQAENFGFASGGAIEFEAGHSEPAADVYHPWCAYVLRGSDSWHGGEHNESRSVW